MVEDGIFTATKETIQLRQLVRSGVPRRWCVEVVNLSTFAVTVSEVGFGRSRGLRELIVPADVPGGTSLPIRLEPREAATVYAGVGVDPDPQIVRRPSAYAETDCGVLRFGTTPLYKAYLAAVASRHGVRH
jgi:hypothetical protein